MTVCWVRTKKYAQIEICKPICFKAFTIYLVIMLLSFHQFSLDSMIVLQQFLASLKNEDGSFDG